MPDEEWSLHHPGWVSREIGNLLLLQERDEGFPELDEYEAVTARKPEPDEERGDAE